MADAYWSYADPRHLNAAAAGLPVKRPRTDIVADVPGGHDLSNYYTSEDGRVVQRVIRDNDPIGASYDNYLRSTQMQVYARNEPARTLDGGPTAIQQQMQVYARNEPARTLDGGPTAIQQQMQVYARNEPARTLDGGLSGHAVDHLRAVGIGVSDPALALKSRSMVMGGGGRSELPLPPDASSTLYVEGLPANCTRREVAHIFRPFVGYKEVRLVTKESRHPGGDPLILCFVDFLSPAHAATALDALEGYKFDEHDRDSLRLRLQFARYPGARSGGGHRGKR